ncbi:MAG: hypothetical protein ACK456_03780 [Pseudanabaenaceae cyanobacterium]|jgi:2-keto-4-pentenoate hydratase
MRNTLAEYIIALILAKSVMGKDLMGFPTRDDVLSKIAAYANSLEVFKTIENDPNILSNSTISDSYSQCFTNSGWFRGITISKNFR